MSELCPCDARINADKERQNRSHRDDAEADAAQAKIAPAWPTLWIAAHATLEPDMRLDGDLDVGTKCIRV